MSAENVFTTHVNLVSLYRYDDGPYASGTYPVVNRTESVLYSGNNTLVSSGRFAVSYDVEFQDSPPNAPLSSGLWFGSGLFIDGFVEPDFFDLSAVSGNMSGMQATSGDSLSIGTWVKISGYDESQQINFISRFTDTGSGDGLWFLLGKELDAVTNNQEYFFQFGTESGVTSEWVQSTSQNTSGVWQHVVGVVDSDGATAKIYVDGIDVTSDASTGPKIYAPQGPGTPLDGIIPFRIGAETFDSTDLWALEGLGSQDGLGQSSGWLAETFVMNTALSNEQVSGIYLSGFLSSVPSSDTNDTQKDNVASGSSTGATLQITAWNGNERANPSGTRHMTSGYHPAFLKVIGEGAISRLDFGSINQGTSSGIVAVTFRSTTDDVSITNMKFWMSDFSAFIGVGGWDVSQHIESNWLPNLSLPSGSGTVGKSLGAASSILQSDGNTTILGSTLDLTNVSGESGISQYIYLSFVTDETFVPGSYGHTGFSFRITSDHV